ATSARLCAGVLRGAALRAAAATLCATAATLCGSAATLCAAAAASLLRGGKPLIRGAAAALFAPGAAAIPLRRAAQRPLLPAGRVLPAALSLRAHRAQPVELGRVEVVLAARVAVLHGDGEVLARLLRVAQAVIGH